MCSVFLVHRLLEWNLVTNVSKKRDVCIIHKTDFLARFPACIERVSRPPGALSILGSVLSLRTRSPRLPWNFQPAAELKSVFADAEESHLSLRRKKEREKAVRHWEIRYRERTLRGYIFCRSCRTSRTCFVSVNGDVY